MNLFNYFYLLFIVNINSFKQTSYYEPKKLCRNCIHFIKPENVLLSDYHKFGTCKLSFILNPENDEKIYNYAKEARLDFCGENAKYFSPIPKKNDDYSEFIRKDF